MKEAKRTLISLKIEKYKEIHAEEFAEFYRSAAMTINYEE